MNAVVGRRKRLPHVAWLWGTRFRLPTRVFNEGDEDALWHALLGAVFALLRTPAHGTPSVHTSVNAARKSACATRRRQRSQCFLDLRHSWPRFGSFLGRPIERPLHRVVHVGGNAVIAP